jgi:hypothetical protein
MRFSSRGKLQTTLHENPKTYMPGICLGKMKRKEKLKKEIAGKIKEGKSTFYLDVYLSWVIAAILHLFQ